MAEEEKTKLTVVKDGVEEVKEISKPTPEEVAQYKEDFDKAVKEFQENRWNISEKGKFNANDVGLFIQDFMRKFAFWTKTGWMGMIKMDEELKKAIELVNEETCLSLDYQALEFCAYMLANPGSIGLKEALEFEKIADKYSKIGIVVGKQIEEARAMLKNVQYLQEKWAAGEQGFYLADLEPKVEEKDVAEELKDHLDDLNSEGKVIQMNPTPKE
jgi:hypothetical protein